MGVLTAAAAGRPVHVLLVEDNPADVRLTEEALREGGQDVKLHVAIDGVDALAFLRREGRYRQAPRPALVVLDLNLPRKDGREVLAEIKTDPRLRRIPVVVLSSSLAEDDVLASYDLNANCYIRKSVNFEEFIQMVKAIEHFWFSVVTLPTNAGD